MFAPLEPESLNPLWNFFLPLSVSRVRIVIYKLLWPSVQACMKGEEVYDSWHMLGNKMMIFFLSYWSPLPSIETFALIMSDEVVNFYQEQERLSKGSQWCFIQEHSETNSTKFQYKELKEDEKSLSLEWESFREFIAVHSIENNTAALDLSSSELSKVSS